MQQQTPNPENYSMEQLERLIESIKRKTGLNEEGIAKELNYNEGYIAQTRSRGKVSIKFIQALQSLLKSGLQNANLNIASEPQAGYADISLSNLTESNKVLAEANRTLAEANKTLAEANHVISKNHDELIQLTKMIVANSKPATVTVQEPSPQHRDGGDRPVEDFLPKGTDLSKKQKIRAVKNG